MDPIQLSQHDQVIMANTKNLKAALAELKPLISALETYAKEKDRSQVKVRERLAALLLVTRAHEHAASADAVSGLVKQTVRYAEELGRKMQL